MAGVTYHIHNVLRNFFGAIFNFEHGIFEVASGSQEITIVIPYHARRVWTSVKGSESTGCGQTPINKLGVLIHGKHITFYIDVQTDQATIEWFAV